jgi:hypothetical protein
MSSTILTPWWITTGSKVVSGGGRQLGWSVLLLLVAHTVELERAEAETIRIISARRADAKERQRYEKERQKSRDW